MLPGWSKLAMLHKTCPSIRNSWKASLPGPVGWPRPRAENQLFNSASSSDLYFLSSFSATSREKPWGGGVTDIIDYLNPLSALE